MLTSLGMIFIAGLFFAKIAEKLHLPSLVGMLIAGILLAQFRLLDDTILNIGSQLRTLALVVVLSRAGLSLDFIELKKIGRPALLLCFVPALFEILALGILGQIFLGLSLTESLLLGSVLGAVSPAVIVPRMLKLMENKKACEKGIPQMVLAGASVDDVFVILVFYSMLSLLSGGDASAVSLIQVPVSIVLGGAFGCIGAVVLNQVYEKISMNEVYQFLLFLSVSFLFLELETRISEYIGFSGLLAVMGMGMMMRFLSPSRADQLKITYQHVWQAAEVLLFVLVGAVTDIHALQNYGTVMIAVIILALCVRSLGVLVCLFQTKLNLKEKAFVIMAYIPKATVQASIGAIPLSAGLACGEIVLCGAVTAILLTAPKGAWLIDVFSKKWLINA